jgi:hypothetical protein
MRVDHVDAVSPDDVCKGSHRVPIEAGPLPQRKQGDPQISECSRRLFVGKPTDGRREARAIQLARQFEDKTLRATDLGMNREEEDFQDARRCVCFHP